MKICKNCKKDFNEKQKTEKYCSTECSYKAIDDKRYARNKTCSLVKCIACNGKGVVKRRVYSILSDEQKKIYFYFIEKGMELERYREK